jgi:membrane-bound metal-dependent hydrolase YbcI (DUF457 family)
MPSPVGHALGGAIVAFATLRSGAGAWLAHRSLGGGGSLGLGRNAFSLVVLAAVLPDIDFAWGGHNRETHSLGAAVIAGLVVWAWQRSPRLAIAVTLSWASHVLFDWLGSDDTPPLGVMALWPINSNFYFADAFVFEAISRRYWLDNFIPHNAWAVIKEILILGPVVAILFAIRRRAN